MPSQATKARKTRLNRIMMAMYGTEFAEKMVGEEAMAGGG
jgi:hypothetical protein